MPERSLKTSPAGLCVRLPPCPPRGGGFKLQFLRSNKPQTEHRQTLAQAETRAQELLNELVAEAFPVLVTRGGIRVQIYFTPTRSGYDAFTVSYYQEGARRREVLADLQSARKRASAILEDLILGNVDVAGMSLKDRTAYAHCLKHLDGLGVSIESACREYAQMVRLLNGTNPVQVAREYAQRLKAPIVPKPVAEVVLEFLEAKEAGLATRLRSNGRQVSRRYLYELNHKLSSLAAALRMPIHLVSAEAINRFIAARKASGRTKNNYVQAINALFEFARKQRYVPRDHDVMSEVDLSAEEDFDIEIFTPAELRALLDHADREIIPVLALGAFAGLRAAEIERLDWDEIHLEQGHIEIKAHKAKTRARRLAPLPPNLGQWLRVHGGSAGRVWPYSAPHMFRLLQRTAKSAAIRWKHNALRHSFISYRVAKTKNVNEVAMEAGNSAEIIFKHYRELVLEADADRWFDITPTPIV